MRARETTTPPNTNGTAMMRQVNNTDPMPTAVNSGWDGICSRTTIEMGTETLNNSAKSQSRSFTRSSGNRSGRR